MSDDGLISDVLEKMIDSQISNTQALTSLKDSIDEMNIKTSDIKSHFTNGFRSDIKDHITKEFKIPNQVDTDILKKLEELTIEVRSFKTIGFWIKTMGGFITAIGAIALAVATIISKIGVQI